MKWWEEELEKAAIMEVDVEPLAKVFKKKCLNVETLGSYMEEDLVGKQEWWDTWVKIHWLCPTMGLNWMW